MSVVLKLLAKRQLSSLYGALRKLWVNNIRSPQKIFTQVYDSGGFSPNAESVSGRGSSIVATEVLRRELPKIIDELRVESMIDAPCGDFNWMKELQLPRSVHYLGCDIVKELIAMNRKNYGRDGREFMVLNVIDELLPKADLIFCRDCLIHLSNDQVKTVLTNFRNSKATYVAMTTDIWAKENIDITTGGYRPINLQLPPFNLPAPYRLIFDGTAELEVLNRAGELKEPKHIGIWNLSDL